MNVNSASKISAKSYGKDYVKESNTTDVRECLTSISAPTVAGNTITITNFLIYLEQKRINDLGNACGKKGTSYSLGPTGLG